MTREEAIKILKDGRENLYGALDKSVPYEQQHTLVALDMAIKALEQQPYEDFRIMAWMPMPEPYKETENG